MSTFDKDLQDEMDGGISWPPLHWSDAVRDQAWPERVLVELRRYFEDGEWLLEPTNLIEARTDVAGDGRPVILAVYEQASDPRRLGLCRPLDNPPPTFRSGRSPERNLVEHMALFEISEPLGRMPQPLLEDEEGVWWRGYRVAEDDGVWWHSRRA